MLPFWNPQDTRKPLPNFFKFCALFLQCVINAWDSVIRLKGDLQLKTPLLKVVC
jgi:hypothetical protein